MEARACAVAQTAAAAAEKANIDGDSMALALAHMQTLRKSDRSEFEKLLSKYPEGSLPELEMQAKIDQASSQQGTAGSYFSA